MKITKKSYLFKIARVGLGRRESCIPVTERLREVKDEAISGLSGLNPNSKRRVSKDVNRCETKRRNMLLKRTG